MKKILFIFFIVLFNSSYAQFIQYEYHKCYGNIGNWSSDIVKNNIDEYYIASNISKEDGVYHTDFKGSQNVGIAKLDKDGNLLWNKCLNEFPYSNFCAMSTTNDNGVIIAAQISRDPAMPKNNNMQSTDFLALKIDRDGNIVWKNIISGSDAEYPMDIIELPENKGYLASCITYYSDGDFTNDSFQSYDYILHLNKFGKIMSIAPSNNAYSKFLIKNGNIFIYSYVQYCNPVIYKVEDDYSISKIAEINFDPFLSEISQLISTNNDEYLLLAQTMTDSTQNTNGIFDYSIFRLNKDFKIIQQVTFNNKDMSPVFPKIFLFQNYYLLYMSYFIHEHYNEQTYPGKHYNKIILYDKDLNILKTVYFHSSSNLFDGYTLFLSQLNDIFIYGTSYYDCSNAFPDGYHIANRTIRFKLNISQIMEDTASIWIDFDKYMFSDSSRNNSNNIINYTPNNSPVLLDTTLPNFDTNNYNISIYNSSPIDTSYMPDYRKRIIVTPAHYRNFNTNKSSFVKLYSSPKCNPTLKSDLKEIKEELELIDIKKSGLNGISISDLNYYIKNLNYLIKKYDRIRKKMKDSDFQWNYNGTIYNIMQIINIYKEIQADNDNSYNADPDYKYYIASTNPDFSYLYSCFSSLSPKNQQFLVEIVSKIADKKVENYLVKCHYCFFGVSNSNKFFSKPTPCRDVLSPGVYKFVLYDLDKTTIKSDPAPEGDTITNIGLYDCNGQPCHQFEIQVKK